MKFYRGVVVNNDDPQKGGRVQVRIFELHGAPKDCTPGGYAVSDGKLDVKNQIIDDTNLPWAEVIQPIDFIGFYPAPTDGENNHSRTIDGKGSKSSYKTVSRSGKHAGTGKNIILAVGVWVFCVLDNDNPNYPIVIGTVCADGEIHTNTGPNSNRIYDSITGFREEWNDDSGSVLFHHRSGTEIQMQTDGDYYLDVVNTKKEYIKNDDLSHYDSNKFSYTRLNYEIIVDENMKKIINGNENIIIAQNQTVDIGSNQNVHARGTIVIKSDKRIYLN